MRKHANRIFPPPLHRAGKNEKNKKTLLFFSMCHAVPYPISSCLGAQGPLLPGTGMGLGSQPNPGARSHRPMGRSPPNHRGRVGLHLHPLPRSRISSWEGAAPATKTNLPPSLGRGLLPTPPPPPPPHTCIAHKQKYTNTRSGIPKKRGRSADAHMVQGSSTWNDTCRNGPGMAHPQQLSPCPEIYTGWAIHTK